MNDQNECNISDKDASNISKVDAEDILNKKKSNLNTP
jgi:hypothetical protein